MILEVEEARERFPHLDVTICNDPRHNEGDDDEAVAVIDTDHDVYPVCEVCLSRIQH